MLVSIVTKEDLLTYLVFALILLTAVSPGVFGNGSFRDTLANRMRKMETGRKLGYNFHTNWFRLILRLPHSFSLPMAWGLQTGVIRTSLNTNRIHSMIDKFSNSIYFPWLLLPKIRAETD